MCCRCKSVHAAVSAAAENPLELRRLLLSWPKEREMDSFILVNEAREAEFQMSKLDLLTSNKAEIRSLQPPHLNLCLSAHPFYATDSGCNLHSP